MEMRESFAKILSDLALPEYKSPPELHELLLPLREFLSLHKPARLFRYRPYNDANLASFDQDLLMLSRASSFNDPFDALPYFDSAKLLKLISSAATGAAVEQFTDNYRTGCLSASLGEIADSRYLQRAAASGARLSAAELNQLAEKGEMFIFYLLALLPDLCVSIRERLHIACFAENVLSVVMWSHYADYHRGFVLEYRFDDQLFCPQRLSANRVGQGWLSLLPVVYSPQRFDATSFGEWFLRHNPRDEDTPGRDWEIRETTDGLLKTKAALYKAAEWSYEQEWRLIYSAEENDPAHKIALRQQPAAIYLGCRMEPLHKKILLHWAREKNIAAYQMYNNLSLPSYELSFFPVDREGWRNT